MTCSKIINKIIQTGGQEEIIVKESAKGPNLVLLGHKRSNISSRDLSSNLLCSQVSVASLGNVNEQTLPPQTRAPDFSKPC